MAHDEQLLVEVAPEVLAQQHASMCCQPHGSGSMHLQLLPLLLPQLWHSGCDKPCIFCFCYSAPQLARRCCNLLTPAIFSSVNNESFEETGDHLRCNSSWTAGAARLVTPCVMTDQLATGLRRD